MIAALLASAALSSAPHYPATSFLAPPKANLEAGLKVNPQVVTVPFGALPGFCSSLGDTEALRYGGQQPGKPLLLGCYIAQQSTVVMPTEETFPYDHACYLQVLAHEDAHAGDWSNSHPGGHIIICYPKN